MLLTLTLATLGLAEPQAVTCTAAMRGTAVTLKMGFAATVKQQGEVLNLRMGDRRYSLPTRSCRGEFGQEFAPAQIIDFNFDGVNDIAVLDGIGYGGVNVYYCLYFVEKDGNVLWESRVDPVEMSNFVADPLSRTLQYSQKSGPAYAVTTLCLLPSGKDYYLCRETSLNPNAQAADDWDYTWFDPQGKALLTRSAKVGMVYYPEMFNVVRKTFFAAQPGEKTGRAYVVAGDQVEVLELRGDWAYVTYRNRKGKVTVGWLARSDLK